MGRFPAKTLPSSSEIPRLDNPVSLPQFLPKLYTASINHLEDHPFTIFWLAWYMASQGVEALRVAMLCT